MTAVSKQTLYDYFCSGGSASNSISTIERELEDLIDTFFGTLTDYSDDSTIVGWTSYITKIIEYKKSTNFVFVNFRITGTSNATTTSFTLPDSLGMNSGYNTCLCGDNGTRSIGWLTMSSSTINFVKGATYGTGNWTNSGTKEIFGQFFFEVA